MKRFAAQTRESKALRQTAVDSHPRETRPREKGYILLTLMLIVSLMVIFAAAVMPAISFEIKRDREQEMIHRGVQYSRAIRAYYKKFGRYPTRLEDLDNTNNLRYLRKHYKDPITGQDFKLLHFGEPGVTVGSGGLSLGGGSIPGANPAGSPTGMNGASPSGSAFGGQPAFGSSGSGVNSSGVFAQSPGFGGNTNGGPNSGFGTNSNSQTNSGQQGTNAASGSDPTQASSQVAPGTAQGDTSSSQQPVMGGPIVGVASVSKKTTIREFNKKKKYNEWQFVYDPTNEPRNGLITTPNQPLLQGFGTQPGQLGQPAGSNGTSSGPSTGFGNSPSPGAPASPVQPSTNPQQPQ